MFELSQRIHKSFLAAPEKKLLLWVAKKLPNKINSDHLTVLGFLGMVSCALSYAFSSRHGYMLFAASFFVIINWIGDSLDGTLARIRNQERPRYGFYVDHILDVIGVTCLMYGLVFSNKASFVILSVLLVNFLILSIDSYLYSNATGIFKLSIWKIGPTEIRILLILLNCFCFFYPYVYLLEREILLFDLAAVVLAILTFFMLIFSVSKNIIDLYNLEKL